MVPVLWSEADRRLAPPPQFCNDFHNDGTSPVVRGRPKVAAALMVENHYKIVGEIPEK